MNEGLQAFWKLAQKDRFKIMGKWKFDRWIFTVAMLAIFGWFYFVAQSYNYELDYFSCGEVSEYYDAGVKCHNPFYEPTTWKNIEVLPDGEYGLKPGPLFNSVYYVPVVVLVLAFLLNARVHNKRVVKK